MKIVSALNIKFATIGFRVTLPKHHGIGAVEIVIGSIKNTVRKSVTGPHQLRMDNEELNDNVGSTLTLRKSTTGLSSWWLLTLTLNHILLGFGDEVNPEGSVQCQLTRWKIALSLFSSLWTQEYTKRCLTVTWKKQGLVSQVGDIVLFRNKPCY